MTEPRPQPGDLGIELDAPAAFTPCWVVYDSRYRGRRALACELLPELFSRDRQPERVAAAAPRSDAPAQARSVDPARSADLEQLGATFAGIFSRLGDTAAAVKSLAPASTFGFSIRTETYWLVYDIDADTLPREPGDILQRRSLVQLAVGLADTLGFLHARGVRHLDICSDTIVGTGQVVLPGLVLRDFARDEEDLLFLTRAGYSPAELYDTSRHSSIGPWTDIYMASATLYALATGEPPLAPGRRPRTADAYRAQVVEALSDVPGQAAIAEAIAAGLAARTNERPQTVEAWRALMDAETLAAANETTQPEPEPEAGGGDFDTADIGVLAAANAEPELDSSTVPEPAAGGEPPAFESPGPESVPLPADPTPAPPAPADSVDEEDETPEPHGGPEPVEPPVPDFPVVKPYPGAGGETARAGSGRNDTVMRGEGPRKVWIMAGIIVGAAVAVLLVFKMAGPQDVAKPAGNVIEGMPTPKPVEAPPTQLPTPAAPAPATPEVTPVATPSATPLPAPPIPAPPSLDILAGTWRRGANTACDAEIDVGTDEFIVTIGRLEFTHAARRDGAGWKTAMTGAAKSETTIRPSDDGRSFEMEDKSGEAETWTKCS